MNQITSGGNGEREAMASLYLLVIACKKNIQNNSSQPQSV